jgi:hypothetical protein
MWRIYHLSSLFSKRLRFHKLPYKSRNFYLKRPTSENTTNCLFFAAAAILPFNSNRSASNLALATERLANSALVG